MKPNDALIEKIQKLLTLANSENENEAKLAADRANELLLKYNLSLQEIKNYQNEYIKTDLVESGLTIKPHHKMIISLVQEYFFVRIIIHSKHVGFSSGKYSNKYGPRSQYSRTIQIVGTKENSKIASYVFQFLESAYPKLWKEYYDTHVEAKPKDKMSYYKGLSEGISDMLEKTRFRVQNETGLVVKDDPNLEKFVKDHSTGQYSTSSKCDTNLGVLLDGYADGTKLNLRKPIESKQSQSETKLLQST